MSSHPTRRFHLEPYLLILIVLVLGYIVLFSGLAFAQHQGMRTHKADLGQIDQAVWNSSQGRFVENTDNGYIATRMTDHVEPILALVSPILWLWDDVRALLMLQVFFVAVGALLLYDLAQQQLNRLLSSRERQQVWQLEPLQALTRPIALTMAIAYLLTAQLQSALLTEFHAAPLAVPLILWAFWAVEKRRWIQFAIATVLVAAVKEEMALLAAGLGLWAAWRIYTDRTHDSEMAPEKRRWILLLALTVTVLSTGWFLIATFVIVPAHAVEVYGVAESGYFQRYGALGDSPVDILRSLITEPALVWSIISEPARLDYLWGLLVPFGLLSLLAPEVLLLSLPLLLANLLSAYPAQYYGEFHYSAPLMPYIAVAAALGLGRLWRWLARRSNRTSASFQHVPAAGTGAMTLASIFHNSRTSVRPILAALLIVWLIFWAVSHYAGSGRGPLGGRYDPTPIDEHHQLLARFTAQVPAEAAVTATAAVHPHLSHRRYIYQFPVGLEEPGQADWALIDVTTNTDMAPGDLKAQVESLLAGDWGVVDAADGFLLLSKTSGRKEIPDAFFDFARADAEPMPPVEQPIQLVQVAAEDWPRWRQTQLAGTWQIGPGFDPEQDLPHLSVRSPAGATIATLSNVTPPALLWYPPERWQIGEAIRITSLPLYLPGDWGVVSNLPTADGDGMQSADGSGYLISGYRREEDDQLRQYRADLWAGGAAEPSRKPATAERVSGTFSTPDGASMDVEATLAPGSYWEGALVDIWLRWSGRAAWPPEFTTFVHLRNRETNRDQNDGMPRIFVALPAAESLEAQGFVDDWRQLQIPTEDLSEGDWEIVVGLYKPESGERAKLVDEQGNAIGSELRVANFRLGLTPTPDQSCALIPQSCASQTRP